MKNEKCPSYDYGVCVTFPALYSVKCGDAETKKCKWLNFDFSKTTYKEYKEKGK